MSLEEITKLFKRCPKECVFLDSLKKLTSIENGLKKMKNSVILVTSIPSDPPPSPSVRSRTGSYRALPGLDREGRFQIKSSTLKIKFTYNCNLIFSQPLEKGRIFRTHAQAVNYVKTSMTKLRLRQ